MISFRYHIVSIIAVFLALALGIVIGTTALNGPITTDLRHQVDSLKRDRTALAKQVKSLNTRVDDANQFAAVYGQQLIAKKLEGQSVLVLGMPNVDSSMQDKVARDLAASGATVTGKIELTGDYIDQRRGTDIASLATANSRPAGLNLPVTSDPGQLGGALLAYVLLGQGEPTDFTSVISAFTQLHMLSVSGNTPQPAKTVVIVTSGALAANSYAASNELALVTALDRAGGHVIVAGDPDSATQAGLVASVRNTGATKTTVSTVDNADEAIGQITSVLATVDSVENSEVGQYGTGAGAQALFPEVN